jgi:hypothetical protein
LKLKGNIMLEQLITLVTNEIQPAGRAAAMAGTLAQLDSVLQEANEGQHYTLADLREGWARLAQPKSEGEAGNIAGRRATCGELAQLAKRLNDEPGSIEQARKVWKVWRDAFAGSSDPRQRTMAATFERELSELA